MPIPGKGLVMVLARVLCSTLTWYKSIYSVVFHFRALPSKNVLLWQRADNELFIESSATDLAVFAELCAHLNVVVGVCK